MEKPRIRGTLAKSLEKNKVTGEKSTLRGSLAPMSSSESTIRGTLVNREVESAKVSGKEGVTVSKEQLPDIESLATLVGRTIIQRDGGKHCEFVNLVDSVRPGKKTVRLVGSDDWRYILPAENFLVSITTDGGAWRLLEK